MGGAAAKQHAQGSERPGLRADSRGGGTIVLRTCGPPAAQCVYIELGYGLPVIRLSMVLACGGLPGPFTGLAPLDHPKGGPTRV